MPFLYTSCLLHIIPEKKLSKCTVGCSTLFKSPGISKAMQTQIIKHATAVARLAPTAIPQNSLGVPSHERGKRTPKHIKSQMRSSVSLLSLTLSSIRWDMFPAARIKNTTATPTKRSANLRVCLILERRKIKTKAITEPITSAN